MGRIEFTTLLTGSDGYVLAIKKEKVYSSHHKQDLGVLTASSGDFMVQQLVACSPSSGLGMTQQPHYRHFCPFELSLIGSEYLPLLMRSRWLNHYGWKVSFTQSPEDQHSIYKIL